MEGARLSFLIRATYDLLPTPKNLKQWYGEDPVCHLCQTPAPLSHILTGCATSLSQGRTIINSSQRTSTYVVELTVNTLRWRSRSKKRLPMTAHPKSVRPIHKWEAKKKKKPRSQVISHYGQYYTYFYSNVTHHSARSRKSLRSTSTCTLTEANNASQNHLCSVLCVPLFTNVCISVRTGLIC